jgi:pimeloyl-ACP methyl ester carboxylesterase
MSSLQRPRRTPGKSESIAAFVTLVLAAGAVLVAIARVTSASATPAGAAPSAGSATTDAAAVRPFAFKASDQALADMRRRITGTQWPESETVPDTTQGVQLGTMQKLARYWGTDYDWRKGEAKLSASRNSSPTSTTWTSISSTSVRSSRTRCRSSSLMDGQARSSNSSRSSIARVFNGQTEGLTRDDVLDNVTLYWLTNTAVSSARLYWESKLPFFAPKHVTVPTAVSVFPDEIYAAPRSWTERAYPKLIHFNTLPKGGHFAAWEQPELFSAELRTAFRSLR